MSIETYGRGERLRVAARLTLPFGIERRIVLLPVPTTRDGKRINSTDITLDEIFEGAESDSYIFGYSIPQKFTQRAQELGASVFDLALDEEYLLENAELTAEGALGYILTTAKSSVKDLSFGIIGYGRIGSHLLKLLLFMGARVRVYSTRSEIRTLLCESGVSAVAPFPLDLSGIDILVNTAPADLSGEFLHGVPLGMRIIELASGENFRGVEGVEKLSAIPEKYYPDSAGRTYATAVKRAILEAAK